MAFLYTTDLIPRQRIGIRGVYTEDDAGQYGCLFKQLQCNIHGMNNFDEKKVCCAIKIVTFH